MLARLLAVACLIFAGVGVLLIRAQPVAPGPSPTRSVTPGGTASSPAPAPAPGVQEAKARPLPDRRGLDAFAWLHHLQTGEPLAPVAARFVDERWRVEVAGRTAALLPASPGYAAFASALDGWAQELGAGELPERPDTDLSFALERVRGFHHSAVVEGLEDLGRRWSAGERDWRVLDLALRGAAYLALQTVDDLELADDLYARAWALLALGRVANLPSVPLAEAILTHRMGYEHAARAASAKLEPIDPLRHWLEHDPALFGEKGPLERGALGTFLRVTRVARTRDHAAWVEYLKQSEIGPEAATYLFVVSGPPRGDPAMERKYGGVTMAHAWSSAAWLLAATSQRERDPGPPPVADFERRLDKLAERGQAFARGLAWSYYRAMYFSGIEQRSRLLLAGEGSSRDAGAELRGFLEHLGPGRSAFAREYLAVLDARARRGGA